MTNKSRKPKQRDAQDTKLMLASLVAILESRQPSPELKEKQRRLLDLLMADATDAGEQAAQADVQTTPDAQTEGTRYGEGVLAEGEAGRDVLRGQGRVDSARAEAKAEGDTDTDTGR
jgi:hypothetical protein